MIYTRQQGARDTRAYLAAVSTYLEDSTEAERDDAVAFRAAGKRYAMEQQGEWPDESELLHHLKPVRAGAEHDGDGVPAAPEEQLDEAC
jgi:hypothetical protein